MNSCNIRSHSTKDCLARLAVACRIRGKHRNHPHPGECEQQQQQQALLCHRHRLLRPLVLPARDLLVVHASVTCHITVANGTTHSEAVGIGFIELVVPSTAGPRHAVLEDALYVPSLPANLLSAKKLHSCLARHRHVHPTRTPSPGSRHAPSLTVPSHPLLRQTGSLLPRDLLAEFLTVENFGPRALWPRRGQRRLSDHPRCSAPSRTASKTIKVPIASEESTRPSCGTSHPLPNCAVTTIFEDTQPAIYIATNPVTSSHSKHFDVHLHYTREELQDGHCHRVL